MSEGTFQTGSQLNTNIHAQTVAFMRRLVGDAKGYFIGIQLHIAGDRASLWFTNPNTQHELSVVFNPLLFDGGLLSQQVGVKIDSDNKDYAARIVRVPVATLRRLSEKLLKMAEEIDALYKEKK